MEDIGSELTDSLSRDGKGDMRASFGIIDGAEATPGLRFNGETGSGLFRESAGEWGLTRLGVLLLRVGTAGLTASKTFICDTAADVVQAIVKGHSTQTADLHQWQNDAGTVLARITAAGLFIGPSEASPPGVISGYGGLTAPSGWLECDGTSYTVASQTNLHAAIADIYGGDGGTNFNVPDIRGKFLRGWDHGATIDPDRATRTDAGGGGTGDNQGTQQDDIGVAHVHTIAHTHTITHTHTIAHTHTAGSLSAASAGAHTHTYSAVISSVQGNAAKSGSSTLQFSPPTSSAGAHTHTITGTSSASSAADSGASSAADTGASSASDSGSVGGNETRPINIYTMFIIKA
jgi:microcystin-dependent protein